MGLETLVVTREEAPAVITLNGPPANAISETLVRELNAAVSGFENDDSVRCLIITGRGGKIFCAGADLGSAFAGGSVDAFIRFGNRVLRKNERFGKPVLPPMNRHAPGAGREVARAGHLR